MMGISYKGGLDECIDRFNIIIDQCYEQKRFHTLNVCIINLIKDIERIQRASIKNMMISLGTWGVSSLANILYSRDILSFLIISFVCLYIDNKNRKVVIACNKLYSACRELLLENTQEIFKELREEI